MTSPDQRPNIILINVDQWRGDCLSIGGHPVVETPYLDQLATEGARFTRAYSATPTCIPARAALHTGLSQRTHGRVGYRDGVPWNYQTTLAGEFTRHGYQTQAVGKMHVYPERSQMGFQNVILHDGFLHFGRQRERNLDLTDDYLPWLRNRLGREADHFDHGINCNSQVARPWDKPEDTHPTNWVASQSIDFLRRRDPRKAFFLYVSFHRPHPPYDPPAWAFEQYVNREMPQPPIGDWVDYLAPFDDSERADPQRGRLNAARLQRARAGYYGHITHIDHQINRFVESLHEYGVRDNSYICFVSDHGEQLGDHHLFRKTTPYQGSAHVPLLLHAPKDSGIERGCVRDEVVELRDIMPTLLDCAGLPIPDSIEGRSFLPIARNEDNGNRAWRKYLHGEHTGFGGSIQWCTDGHQKYVWFSKDGHEQLFDLDNDPQEKHDLARESNHQAHLSHWRERLIAELTDREEGFVDDGDLIPGQPVSPVLSHIIPSV